MSFRSLFSACFLLALCSSVPAQSGSEQSILFSTPDGQTVTNAVLPITQAPESARPDLSDLPDMASTVTGPKLPVRPVPFPIIATPSHAQRDADDGPETPAEIMGVPTLRQIFGLPKADATTTNMNSMSENSSTNFYPSANSFSGDALWTKIQTSDPDGTGFNTTNSESASDAFSGLKSLFDSTSTESSLHRKRAEDPVFDSSSFAEVAARQQALDDSTPSVAPIVAPAFAPPAPPAPVFSSGLGFNSPTPFALPRSSAPEQSIPQLPSLPTISGQNNSPAQPVVPSWAPKPPPWSSSTPQLGTMPQRQF